MWQQLDLSGSLRSAPANNQPDRPSARDSYL